MEKKFLIVVGIFVIVIVGLFNWTNITGNVGWGKYRCSLNSPCDVGEGDCDVNAHCNTGLCNQNNGEKYGELKWLDICEYPTPCIGNECSLHEKEIIEYENREYRLYFINENVVKLKINDEITEYIKKDETYQTKHGPLITVKDIVIENSYEPRYVVIEIN